MLYTDSSYQVRSSVGRAFPGIGDLELQWFMDDKAKEWDCEEDQPGFGGEPETLSYDGGPIPVTHWNAGIAEMDEDDVMGEYGLSEDDLDYLTIVDAPGKDELIEELEIRAAFAAMCGGF